MEGRSKNRCRKVATRVLLSLWRPALNLTLATGLLGGAAGCTRHYYTHQADEDVGEIVANKDKYPDWKIENWWIYPDPRARFADTSNPDRPAMPPDDPAAYCLSPNPQKPYKAGVERIEGSGYLDLIAKWDKENRERRAKEDIPSRGSIAPPVQGEPTPPAEPPGPEASGQGPNPNPAALAQEGVPNTPDAIREAKAKSLLDISGRPAFLLTLDNAAELAMFNAREYQDQREDLYLAALPVAQERFAFMPQLFAATEAIRTYAGNTAPGGPQNNWTLNNGIGMSKVLPTGALLLLNFANQTVFNFLNPHTVTSVSTLNFSAIQPLLQGGGEAVALESLTQAERNLLYQIRNYARFRKELYVAIASNNGGAISGGAFQPTGVLSSGGISVSNLGFSGLNPGVPLPIATTLSAPVVPVTGPGALNLAPAISPLPSGYLNTMLEKITVYIDQENIDVLIPILERYRELLKGDQVQPLQVQSVEQQLLTGRSTLLADQQNYLESLDAFKLEIGVPMSLSIEMDDSVLQPLIRQFRSARAITEDEQRLMLRAYRLGTPDQIAHLRAALADLFVNSALTRGTKFASNIGARWGQWEKLSNAQLAARLKELQAQRKKLEDLRDDLDKQDKPLPPDKQRELNGLYIQLDLGNFENLLRQYQADYLMNGKPKPLDRAADRIRISNFDRVIGAWQKVLVEARDERWDRVTASWPALPRACVDGVNLVTDPIDTSLAAADRHALLNRLDLMNVRAQVVDAWRQIAIYANALLGTFNVQYNLSASSPVGLAKPLAIGGSATTNQLVLDAAPPLVRITQRNNYRASQIAFQRQRRALQEAEDLAVQAVNIELTNLRQFAEQYKIQQRQLKLAYLTIDSSLESLQAPVAPAAPFTGAARTVADGPAALTQQLLTAQRSLPTAQDALLLIWISYLDQRLQLYRDLELMPLDQRGVWIDEVRDCDCKMQEATSLPMQPVPGELTQPSQPEGFPEQLPPLQAGPSTDAGPALPVAPQALPAGPQVLPAAAQALPAAPKADKN